MDKLLDKVGPGLPWGQGPMEGASGKPFSLEPTPWFLRGVILLAESSGSCPRQEGRRDRSHAQCAGLTPSPFVFQISELEGNLQTLRNSNST